MKGIAFFDFDGTITCKDTLWEIIRFQKGATAMYAGIIKLLPDLVLFKLKKIPAQDMKQRVLEYFFGEMKEQQFADACRNFCHNRLPQLIRKPALTAIQNHQSSGHQVVVVTASAYHWVAPWCQSLGIACIATLLEVKDHRITGRILGINCNGHEKVARIMQEYNMEDYGEIYAYGDSEGDAPMLALSPQPQFKPFR
ncbi:MAG TPA: HAD-IB family hydrolase [Chitinophaga sp.]|uniref:HAD-IB family hydrolase n=1 Tax=Chitinophaga sp. TaxID=1869181 RepID=UPI002C90B92A|nr:HAD-IB family hydrolase [Chitinophaga sp.]HVI46165.1 HAD-IB family hydrolase [Chitinophaga sp.]